MLTISQVSKSYGGRTLYENVSLQVNRTDRIGLVGPNGAGKSTLFSIILRENEPDDGSIVFDRGTTVGFLPQESAPAGDETVLALATAIPGSDDYDRHNFEPKAKRILSGLAFRESDFDRPAKTMSGGWIMRAHLARLLTQEPDLLMLDEPTNHLDLESLEWFQNYLHNYAGAILMISHDRAFLNALCDAVIDVRRGKLTRYRGNYNSYLEQRAAREEQQMAAYKTQQKEIAALQEFADRFRAKASKASQAQSKLKQIERMEKIEAPTSDEKSIKFRFPQPPRSGLKVASLVSVRQAYGEMVVYDNLHFEAERGQRTVLVGPNGSGKSTLLKILAGVLPIQGGTRDLGANVKVGYFTQHRVEMLQPARTVLAEVMDMPNPVNEQSVRSVLGSFLFRGDDIYKKVGVLSGGEKSRLALVKLLLDPPNLLLMDEPTTHLDIGSIDALVGALQTYEGTLIFISHDVYFIRALATSVLHISRGQLTPYAGDYQYYLDKTKATSEKAALVAGEKLTDSRGGSTVTAPVEPAPDRPVFKTKDQKRVEAEVRQMRSKAKKENEDKLAAVESEIAALEKKQSALSDELSAPATYATPQRATEINQELGKIRRQLEAQFTEWDELSAKLEKLSAD
jgi:ATP-binding cassette, subfamily F, member 3